MPQSFTQREWAVVEAITARILPTDDKPGAVEAGCVNSIDKALANEDAAALPLYCVALRELDRSCGLKGTGQDAMGQFVPSERRHDVTFVDLCAGDQDEMLGLVEIGEVKGWRIFEAEPRAFFQTVRMHTILGFVLDPKHGGNRGYAGWKTMGFPGPVHHLGGSRPEHMSGQLEFIPVWDRKPRSPHGDDQA